ncbi:rhodanese-like domain-containing protein [Halobacillus salinarum]|uniref:Rhodanese-like domain-containing protein n=1 Tax=Halobacillus salinarum TaxID=2932257 RepID=A0ABY4EI46_9BACI|nr:rhodanese-like domain-containing protein [Halobacillus salinarum]UOQ44153.1 rhodanese-like domain-containing protein [Halobacillus salinarum]
MAETIKPEEVERKRKSENVSIIDVRTAEEVTQGKIPNAIHIPVDQIEQRLIDLDKTKEYITVCRSGRRSDKAADIMNEKGLQAENMEGGMEAWKGEVR